MHVALIASFGSGSPPTASATDRKAPMLARVIPVATIGDPRPPPAPPAQDKAAALPAQKPRSAHVQPPAPPQAWASPTSSLDARAAPSTQRLEPKPVTSGASDYRPAPELDPPPRPLGDIDPEYPAHAGLQEGTVVLRLLISETGSVDEITVIDASPQGVFEESAIAAFAAAKFSPGRMLGMPVRSQLTIAVDYTPTNRGGAVSGASR